MNSSNFSWYLMSVFNVFKFLKIFQLLLFCFFIKFQHSFFSTKTTTLFTHASKTVIFFVFYSFTWELSYIFRFNRDLIGERRNNKLYYTFFLISITQSCKHVIIQKRKWSQSDLFNIKNYFIFDKTVVITGHFKLLFFGWIDLTILSFGVSFYLGLTLSWKLYNFV